MPIAHRGLHTEDLPENSLEAFDAAVKNNFAIELDVRTIDDGSLIVFHDDRLARMTGVDGYAGNLSPDALKDLRLLGTDSIVPTFEQTLETVNGKTPLLIEIKNDNKVGTTESKLLQMLKGYNGEYAIQSFNPYSVGYFKEHLPDTPRGQLSMVYQKNQLTFMKRYFLGRLKLNRVSAPDFIAYNANDLPNKYVTRTKLPVIAWTVRSQSEFEKVAPYCDNIIFENFIPKFETSENDN